MRLVARYWGHQNEFCVEDAGGRLTSRGTTQSTTADDDFFQLNVVISVVDAVIPRLSLLV